MLKAIEKNAGAKKLNNSPANGTSLNTYALWAKVVKKITGENARKIINLFLNTSKKAMTVKAAMTERLKPIS